MKRIVLCNLLLLSALAWAGTNPNPADYTTRVHVRASRMAPDGGARWQELDVVIDGKSYELVSDDVPNTLLALGDYKAKLVKDEHRAAYESYQVYEFLFPDQKTRKFIVIGKTE